jgi:hypothetical protein
MVKDALLAVGSVIALILIALLTIYVLVALLGQYFR